MNPSENKIITNNQNQTEQKNIINKNIDKETKEINRQDNQEIINQIYPQNKSMNIKNLQNNIFQNQITPDISNINSIIPTSQPSSSKLNLDEFQNEKEEFQRTQKYINYLKTHLDSSYYAFNEIKNKNTILLTKTKSLENEIKKNNLIYQKLVKSIQEKTKENSSYKEKYEKILEQKKNCIDMGELTLDKKIEKLKQNNLILSKENKSKEEIILNLRKTLEILEKNKNEKTQEKKERLKELKEEKNSIEKLKVEFAEMGKELNDKLKELEKTKTTMLYLLEQKNNNLEDNENPEEQEEQEEKEEGQETQENNKEKTEINQNK